MQVLISKKLDNFFFENRKIKDENWKDLFLTKTIKGEEEIKMKNM